MKITKLLFVASFIDLKRKDPDDFIVLFRTTIRTSLYLELVFVKIR